MRKRHATLTSKKYVETICCAQPSLIVLAVAAAGPLLIMLVYSFLEAGAYGGVIWKPSLDGWFDLFFNRDICNGTVSIADAHLSILWRSVQSFDSVNASGAYSRIPYCIFHCYPLTANPEIYGCF